MHIISTFSGFSIEIVNWNMKFFLFLPFSFCRKEKTACVTLFPVVAASLSFTACHTKPCTFLPFFVISPFPLYSLCGDGVCAVAPPSSAYCNILNMQFFAVVSPLGREYLIHACLFYVASLEAQEEEKRKKLVKKVRRNRAFFLSPIYCSTVWQRKKS